jgi:hypothetical protein
VWVTPTPPLALSSLSLSPCSERKPRRGYYKSYYSYTVYSSQPPVMVQQQSAAAVAGWFVPLLVFSAWLAGVVSFLRGFALTRCVVLAPFHFPSFRAAHLE